METETTKISTVELLSAGILALTDADAVQLAELTEAAAGVRRIETAGERRAAQEKLRTLGALIGLTRRNLRLLRGAADYGILRD
jgi:hypothetical protein